MSNAPRLTVIDATGRRSVTIDASPFGIGRRTSASLQVVSRDVSREHAEIAEDRGRYLLRDVGSRFGTFVNGEPVTEPRALAHGDRIRLGRSDEVELTFLAEAVSATSFTDPSGALPDLRHLAAILDGLRALGSGRVLDEVLTLVLDSALEVTTADRGFIMLGERDDALLLRVARSRGRQVLEGTSFERSEKIPRDVFRTGETRIVSDLFDVDLAAAHEGTIAAGIRHVLCVPLSVGTWAARSDGQDTARTIGVLYLDGRERATLLSSQTRSTLEAFATQAALAIDSARLYAEAAEKARLERDLRVAAEIQQALLPRPRHSSRSFDLAATSVPCRTIGGDFFDYLDLPDGAFGFTLGDVSGKGPPAALLAATVQSQFAAQAALLGDPAAAVDGVNRQLLRRAIEARFATMFVGVLGPDGRLMYCNAGQEPPLLVRADGRTESLDVGGPPVGILEIATYEAGVVALAPGDVVIVFSDGVTEARNDAGEEYGGERLTTFATGRRDGDAGALLDRLVSDVSAFVGNAPQADDLTALVLRYHGT